MYCTVEDVNILFRPLSPQEKDRTTALIPIVEDTLRQEAKKLSKDLDQMIEKGELLPNVLKSVIVRHRGALFSDFNGFRATHSIF